MKALRRASRGRVLFASLLALWLVSAAGPLPAQTPSPPAPKNTGRFGVVESYEDPAAAGRLGAAWTRVRFQWAEVQPDSPAEWNPPLDDEALAAELDAGRLVVGLVIGIPDWARDRDGLPRGLDLPPDDPRNTWATFMREVVGRYEGRIDHWIIWNEPDIDDFDAPGHTWDGTMEDFFQLQRTAYLVAKETNPAAVVHLGAFTYYWDPGYFRRFLDLVATDPAAVENDYYFDIATAHLYFQPGLIYTIIDVFYRVMATHNLDQPIWLVETNAPPINDPYWEVDNWTLAVSLNEQAAFIPQALASALAAGAERIAVYKLKDTPGDRAANPEPFGLMRWDSSRRPAFDTYRVAIRLLAGVTTAERERWDAVGQIRLDQPEQTTTVLFSRLPQPQTAKIRATSEKAEWIDMWGRAETIEPEDGFFTVGLPGALCLQTIADYCMIGGTTYYLIQAVDESLAATALPAQPTKTPAATAAPTNQPTATATDTPPAATVSPTASPAAAATETPVAVVANVTRDDPPETMETGITPAITAGAPSILRDYAGLVLIGVALLLAVVIFARQLTRRRR